MGRIAVNGIHLNVEDSGGDGPALLLLHGFTGDVSTWEPLLPDLAAFRVLRLDVIGHGASDAPADPERYTMTRAVEDILALLDGQGIDGFGLCGYSMGGRLALHLALAAPQRVRALLLESASPGIEDTAERKARIQSDEALARSIETDGLESFVDRWQAQPLFASQQRLPADVFERQRQRRLASSPIGLANSLRGMGAGRQEWLLPRLGQLAMPGLVIAGSLDAKYAALAPQIAACLPDARLHIVENAGHAVHLEQPQAFVAVFVSFFSEHLRPAIGSVNRHTTSRGLGA